MGDKFTLDELRLLEELIDTWYTSTSSALRRIISDVSEISVDNALRMLNDVYDTWVSISNKLEAREVTAK